MTEKILIVDDDVDTLRLVGLMLQRQGYQISAAANGQQGLSKAAEENPDLILLDVMMPELDGFAACAKLKSSPQSRGIPVVLLTGVAKQITRTRYPIDGVLRAEANDYLEKPLEPEALLKAVACYLN